MHLPDRQSGRRHSLGGGGEEARGYSDRQRDIQPSSEVGEGKGVPNSVCSFHAALGNVGQMCV